MAYDKIGFIAPSTCLSLKERPLLNRTARRLRKALGVQAVYFSPHLYLSDAEIDHVTAPVDARAAVFKEAIRELDLIISVAGGTGGEDLVRKIDAKDLRVIRTRRPLFVGFSDFTFPLNEIYFPNPESQIPNPPPSPQSGLPLPPAASARQARKGWGGAGGTAPSAISTRTGPTAVRPGHRRRRP